MYSCIPNSCFPPILPSAFCLLPSLCRASPSAPCNQNLDPERCVSITTSIASTYQISHSERFDNSLSHSMFQNPRFAPHPADCASRPAFLHSSFCLLHFPTHAAGRRRKPLSLRDIHLIYAPFQLDPFLHQFCWKKERGHPVSRFILRLFSTSYVSWTKAPVIAPEGPSN